MAMMPVPAMKMALKKKPQEAKNPNTAPPKTDANAKVGAAQIFGRTPLSRTVAPEAAGPDKDAEMKKQKQKKMGAAEIFGRGR